MRTPKTSVSENIFIQSVAGVVYRMAPNHVPRKMDIIMTKLRDLFRSLDCIHNMSEWYYATIDSEKLEATIREMLLSVPEFEELNLTYYEAEKGISVNDPKRGKYKFVSAYDKLDSESWKDDFIDLDACVRNIIDEILFQVELDKDCHGCMHHDKPGDDTCQTCSHNMKLKDNYESDRDPAERREFNCSSDCNKGLCICCKDCAANESCQFACADDPHTCDFSVRSSLLTK